MKLCTKPYIGAIKPPRDYKRWNPEEQVNIFRLNISC